MVNYNNGKIYKIVCNITGLVYVGSTTKKYLSSRLAEHRSHYKAYISNKYHHVSAFKIIETGDYDIILLELVNCNTKDELHKRERYYIEKLDCVNQKMPYRSK
eukprot:SAG11_NODE_17752_length_509_cov_372.278049_1_plen_102_part_01